MNLCLYLRSLEIEEQAFPPDKFCASHCLSTPFNISKVFVHVTSHSTLYTYLMKTQCRTSSSLIHLNRSSPPIASYNIIIIIITPILPGNFPPNVIGKTSQPQQNPLIKYYHAITARVCTELGGLGRCE